MRWIPIIWGICENLVELTVYTHQNSNYFKVFQSVWDGFHNRFIIPLVVIQGHEGTKERERGSHFSPPMPPCARCLNPRTLLLLSSANHHPFPKTPPNPIASLHPWPNPNPNMKIFNIPNPFFLTKLKIQEATERNWTRTRSYHMRIRGKRDSEFSYLSKNTGEKSTKNESHLVR